MLFKAIVEIRDNQARITREENTRFRKGEMVSDMEIIPKGTVLDVYGYGLDSQHSMYFVAYNEQISKTFITIAARYCRPL